MANQTDNVLLDDDTTGLPRTIDVGADALFLSTDLTLQAGGILTADNVKRGTTDPNIALLVGNEGDLYQRTVAAGGQLWVNTDGTTTGWVNQGVATPVFPTIWRFSTNTTAADPGSGNFRMNNATPASVTEIYVDQTNHNNLDLQNYLSTLANGDELLIQQGNDSGRIILFTITSTTDNTGWWTLNVTVESVLGGLFDNNAECLFVFKTAAAAAVGWPTVLSNDNTTGGSDAEITSGDSIVGQANGAGDGGDIPITAGSATAGNDNGGDIVLSPGSGFGTGVDGIVQVNGPKHYASSTTDPTVPTPADGDRYYNTTLDMEMRYDSTRAKWLSVEAVMIDVSDQGALTSGSYFQVGTLRMSSTRGFPALYNGTVVGLGYTRSDSDAASFAVTEGGTTISSVASTATTGKDITLNDNFSQDGILAIRNDGANSMSDGICWVRVKWRA